MTGLYFHVPFCKSKCPYCNFYSVAQNKEIYQKYTDAVIRNITGYSDEFNKPCIDTVYFGGGTPSLLPIIHFERIMNAVYSKFCISENAEISFEANPCTLSLTLLKNMYSIGLNRISIGVQSFNDNELKKLGRLHNSKTAINSIKDAFNAGFKNISADLMLGIIDQNINSIDSSISEIKNLPLTHISAYMLKIEDSTPYSAQRFTNQLPSDDDTADLYLYIVDELKKIGIDQYEISNFARQGYESRHNIIYWNSDSYIGIGPSAHSYFNGKRYGVTENIEDFCNQKFQTESITDYDAGSFFEYAMLKIRLIEGINLDECNKKYDIDADKILQKCHSLQNSSLILLKNKTISLTPSGCLISNQIINYLFD